MFEMNYEQSVLFYYYLCDDIVVIILKLTFFIFSVLFLPNYLFLALIIYIYIYIISVLVILVLKMKLISVLFNHYFNYQKQFLVAFSFG